MYEVKSRGRVRMAAPSPPSIDPPPASLGNPEPRQKPVRSCFSAIERIMDMPVFQTPGLADQGVSKAVLTAWNARVKSLLDDLGVSPFLVLDPRDILDGETSAAFKWPANPREPLDCLGEDLAVSLSDLGWMSRAELHNEYLEYALVMRPDPRGTLRPKRFVATTEFAEWWAIMAAHDMPQFLDAIRTVTRRDYSLDELFGMPAAEWTALDISERMACFQKRLLGMGPGCPPEHPVNIEHALFMARGTNGLKDLLSVVHFGSFPYVASDAGTTRRARLDEIFSAGNRQDQFCRNASASVVQDVYDHAYIDGTGSPQGRTMAFTDPLGLYIRAFDTSGLRVGGADIPSDWLRFPRGASNMPIRAEFGPADDDPRFLDEVTIGAGASARPVSGYGLAKLIEVGPLMKVAAQPRIITRVEFAEIPAMDPSGIICGLPGTPRCKQISDFADLCESGNYSCSDLAELPDE